MASGRLAFNVCPKNIDASGLDIWAISLVQALLPKLDPENQLIGRAEVLNLSSPLMGRGEAAQIGNFALEFDSTTESEAGTLTGTISDTGGPLELKGSLLLVAPGSYTLKTRLKARPDAPEAMQNNLKFLGSPMADGRRIFELAGTL